MGEGGNKLSHCPLPKVVGRSEEVPQKLNLNQDKTMNLLQPITVITGLEDKREALPLPVYPSLENYHNINSLGFSTRAWAHLLRNLAKESDNWENDDDYSEGRYELAIYESEISLYTQKIELYERALSLYVNPQRYQRRWRNSSISPSPVHRWLLLNRRRSTTSRYPLK